MHVSSDMPSLAAKLTIQERLILSTGHNITWMLDGDTYFACLRRWLSDKALEAFQRDWEAVDPL